METTMTHSNDFPLLRAFHQCPLCGHDKPRGALACWPCFTTHRVGEGDDINKWAQARIDRAEANLSTAAMFAADHPKTAASMGIVSLTRPDAASYLVVALLGGALATLAVTCAPHVAALFLVVAP
jgi:hypothetical protein